MSMQAPTRTAHSVERDPPENEMIRFIVTSGHGYTLRTTRSQAKPTRIEIISYDQLIRSRRIRRATTIFTDLDRLSTSDLELASALYRCLAASKVPVLNDPARAKTRYAMLRALHEAGLNDFNAYRVEEERLPKRYPVFLRRDAGHGVPLSGLLDNREQVVRAIESALEGGAPERNLVIIEYAAEPIAPGIFRKLAVSRIGDRLVPQSSVHDDNWLVKYGKLGVATEEHYKEEARIFKEMPYAEAMWRAFEIASISYGRADFGLVDGRVQVYEINTNPTVNPGEQHSSATRMASLDFAWSAHLDAIRALDAKYLDRDFVDLVDERLAKHQRRRIPPIRTRKSF